MPLLTAAIGLAFAAFLALVWAVWLTLGLARRPRRPRAGEPSAPTTPRPPASRARRDGPAGDGMAGGGAPAREDPLERFARANERRR